ncbi:type VI secretion protein IcmF/TssM N-terminal domain-containing protein, partial [Burkholderia sp. Ap-962]|uniref:type VI secretion protein IcmF/TssM N-terminal domain-containing protein n=1 Tax=Burkholderia sp. Ap-962 TaxID=2608333 RepID=UPI0031F52796
MPPACASVSDAADDASAWQAFLTLLRRYRRRRPITGVIVTMRVSDLLSFDEHAPPQQMRTVRRRLAELPQYLTVPVPAYRAFLRGQPRRQRLQPLRGRIRPAAGAPQHAPDRAPARRARSRPARR